MKVAIVTGASSGLGKEFVKQLDERYSDSVEEFWLIARRGDRLRQVAAKTQIPCRILELDLTDRESIDELSEELAKERPEVTFFVNAAGLGRLGRIDEVDLDDLDATIDLDCRAAVASTKAVIPYLKKKSRVLEICSTAGFQPMPRLNVYSASKAFLINFTKLLHHELLFKGVHVTAVCPYWIKDTEFIQNAERTGKAYGHYILANKASTVVKWALFDSAANFWVSTPGPVCFAHRIFAAILPNVATVPFMELFRRI